MTENLPPAQQQRSSAANNNKVNESKQSGTINDRNTRLQKDKERHLIQPRAGRKEEERKRLGKSPVIQQCLNRILTSLPSPSVNLTVQFSSVQLLSCVWLFVTPWTSAHQASLSITNCRSPPKPMSIESVMPSNHLTLCRPLLLLPSIFPSIRVFSNESALCIRWSKYWSFSFNVCPSNEHPGLISFRMDWLDLLAVQGTLKSLL